MPVTAKRPRKISQLPQQLAVEKPFMVKFSPDGQYLACVNISSVVVFHHLVHHKTIIAACTDISWSSDSSCLLLVADNALESLRNFCFRLQYEHTGAFAATFNQKGNLIASGSVDGSVKLFNTTTAAVIRTLPAHSELVTMVEFSNDGTLLLTCSFDGLMYILLTAVASGIQDSASVSKRSFAIRTLQCSSFSPRSHAAFSPNSRFILASTLDSTLRVWDFISGKIVKSYTGHENTQFCINAVFYKQFVISGSENGIICFWDLQSRELVHSLKSHEGVVSYIGISSELNILVSASTQDMVVNVWDLNQIVDAIGAN